MNLYLEVHKIFYISKLIFIPLPFTILKNKIFGIGPIWVTLITVPEL